MLAVGIDFGTSRTRVAVWRSGAPLLVPFPDGARSMPSVVSVSADGVLTGQPALSRALAHPAKTVRAARRLLGRSVDDALVQALSRRLAYKVEASSSGRMLVRLDGRRYELAEVAATLLGDVADHVAGVCRERVGAVVLGAPAWFAPEQHAALAEVARRAKLGPFEVHSEAVCSALSMPEPGEAARTIALVDLGAAGVSATLLALEPGGLRVLGAAGDPYGGGDDLDSAMSAYAFTALKARLGQFKADGVVVEALRQACEVAKHGLAESPKVSASIPFLPAADGGKNQRVEFDWVTAERLMRDAVERVGAACRKALEQSGLQRGQLAAVYVLGGSAHLPPLCSAVSRVLGEPSPSGPSQDDSVALGAARWAAMNLGLTAKLSITELAGFEAAGATPARRSAAEGSAAEPQATVGQRIEATAFRDELALLLSGLQAGTVTTARERKPKQAAPSTNEVLEEPEELEARTIEHNAQRLRALWTQLAVVMQTARQYRWDHPQTERQVERAMAEIGAGVAEAAGRSVQWEVKPLEFSYRGHSIWKPDRAPYDRIPYELFAGGVRRMQLQPGLSSQELRELLGVMLRDAALGFGADDDAATALWDRKLAHVAWHAVDAFAEGDDPVFEEQRDAIARQLGQLAAVSEEGESGLATHAAARREASEAASGMDTALREQLPEPLEPEPQAWLELYAAGFAEAYRSKHLPGPDGGQLGSLGEWAERQVGAHAPEAALQVFSALDKAAPRIGEADARKLRQELVAAMFPPERVALVFQELEDERQASEELLGGLRRVLELHPSDALFDAVSSRWTKLSGPTLDLVFELVARRARGHEAALGKLLGECSAAHAHGLLAALRGLDTAAAGAALAGALYSPHLAIRLEGLAALPDAPAERVRDQIQRLVEDPDAALRMQVLQLILERRLMAAAPSLMRRIHADSFPSLPATEQKTLLQALGVLNRRRADEFAIGWLDKKQLFEGKSSESTRAIAAEFLGGSDADEALHALQRHARRPLLGSSAVADAAASALERWKRRREESEGRTR